VYWCFSYLCLIFTKLLPSPIVYRIWDMFIVEDYDVLLCSAAALVLLFDKKGALKGNFQELLK